MGRPVVLDNEACYTVRYDVRRSEWHAAKVTVNDKQMYFLILDFKLNLTIIKL